MSGDDREDGPEDGREDDREDRPEHGREDDLDGGPDARPDAVAEARPAVSGLTGPLPCACCGTAPETAANSTGAPGPRCAHDLARYDRQMRLPQVGPAGQARLAAARVLVVGAGGLGAAVIPLLAGAGVGRLTIIDGDSVALTNLHRQTIFIPADLDQPKAARAAAYASALNPQIAVEAVTDWLDPANAAPLVAGADLVVDAADSFAVTYTLSDLCAAGGVALVSASALGMAGYVGTFCADGPSYRAVFPDLPDSAPSCDAAGVLGPVVATLGALQAQAALLWLLGDRSGLGRVTRADLATMRFVTLDCRAAAEPAGALPFVGLADLGPGDLVVDLRGESPVPVTPGALRLDRTGLAGWTPPRAGRVVLCCRTGLRAFHAARDLAARGIGPLALMAAR